jgi:Eukaryotic aspartyl protease
VETLITCVITPRSLELAFAAKCGDHLRDDITFDWPVRYWGTTQSPSTQEVPGGQLTLGGVNSSLFTGQIHYIGLSDVNWWTIPMDSVVVNDHEITLTGTVKNAIIDTGTTLVGEW